MVLIKKKGFNRILRFFKAVYLKLFRVNDTPQKVALGLGIGVFTGIVPGMGPLAALFLALLFKVNRASALLGSLLTNTWLSLVTFILSVKIGSFVMQLRWHDVYDSWILFFKNFRFLDLFKISILKIMLPVFIGYCLVALFCSLVAYLITLLLLKNGSKRDKNFKS